MLASPLSHNLYISYNIIADEHSMKKVITMLLTKKTILGVSKSIPFYVSPRLSTASLSTAYERAEGSNAVAEGSGSEDGAMKREDMYEVKQEDMATSNDPARDGPVKAVEGADMVRDTAKESMDGAWKASQEYSPKVREINDNKLG